ncbi:hypothetical protein [Halorientalis halophila]|uniref:hypothetical protein n=1 Tax=Halorientalis halophila TaxID=3108499 RepID=UPI00300ABB97
MIFRDDERGQAIQIGAVLLFAALIIAFSTYQAFVVPNQNKQVEFTHSQEVQGQLQDVRNAIVSVPGGNTGRSVTVDLGVRYPSRLVALNPGPASGSLRTVGTTDGRYNLTIENATASGSGELADFWNGSAHVYETGGLVYTPDYNRYDEAPRSIYENSVLYGADGDQSVPRTGQGLIEGDRITLVTLNGSLDATRTGAISVDTDALSTSTRTVSVRNTSHNVTIEVPTRLSAERWRELTAGESNVAGLTVDPGTIDGDWGLLRLDLEPDTTYDLRMAKVGVGTGRRASETGYLLPVEGNGSSVPEGGDERLVVEVRDRFNNPVSGVDVNASAAEGTVTEPGETDDQGRVALEYSAPGDITTSELTDTVRVSYAVDQSDVEDYTGPFDAGRPENAVLRVNVRDTDGGSGGSSAYTVDWLAPDATGDNSGAALSNCDDESCVWDVGNSGSSSLTLRSDTTPSVEGVTHDYGVNDSTVASSSKNTETSDANGEATTDLLAQNNGTVGVFVASGGSSEDIAVELVNVGAGGGGSDTTPPTISSAAATHDDNSGIFLDFDDDVFFDLQASDASGIDRTILTASRATNGNQFNQRVVTTSPGSFTDESLALNAEASFNGNNGVAVNMTVVDDAGNARTCTGTIDNSGDTIDTAGGGLTCN